MAKYLIANSSSTMLKFNRDTESLSSIDNQYLNADRMWIADEDGVITTKDGDVDVLVGDIILRMYPSGEGDRDVFIIKDDNLKSYYKRLIEYRLKRDNERLSEQKCCDESISPCTGTVYNG